MSWKLSLIACISALLTAFPQNMIGCGPDTDPYDYYAHFFSANQWEGEQPYRPFYYTGFRFLYDENNTVETSDALLDEWLAYTGKSVTRTDASDFIFGAKPEQLKALQQHLIKKEPFAEPESFQQNSFTRYIIKKRDLEGLQYLIFAKSLEPYVTGDPYAWEPVKRDSAKMAVLIAEGLDLHRKAKKAFYRLKYAYQVIRLAHYSSNYADAIRLYDQLIPKSKSKSVLQPMSLSLKAGALLRTGKPKEAAYHFSKVFAATPVKRISNYISFDWSIKSEIPMDDYLALCKNDTERANMLALFGLNTADDARPILKEMYAIAPASQALEVLAVREINKIEEHYFTPRLASIPGGSAFYFSWYYDGGSEEEMAKKEKDVNDLTSFFETLAYDPAVHNRGLYANGAAYLHMMLKNFPRAHQLLKVAEGLNLNAKLKDQWALTNLLVTINEADGMDAKLEEKILPSLQWLFSKVEEERNSTQRNEPVRQWSIFYRNLFSEVLAKKYHAVGNRVKETMMIGSADYADAYYHSMGMSFMREKVDAATVKEMYDLYNQKSPSAFDNFLINHNSIRKTDIVDYAGTAFLREHKFEQAVEWLSKNPGAHGRIDKDPFRELLYDREHILPGETAHTTRLDFAREMIRLQNISKSKSNQQPEYLYKMALGFYNMTYYGYAWELAEYYRSGSDGYFIPKDAGKFESEYYGAFTAHDYFQKAMNASNNKEFKAKCLFMMAKCSQKQISQPRYDYNNSYTRYQDAMKTYGEDFENNRYFPEFVQQYGNTSFYQTAFNSCSYLRDFVKKQKAK